MNAEASSCNACGHGHLNAFATNFGRNVAVGLTSFFVVLVVVRIAHSPSMLFAYPKDVWSTVVAAAGLTAFQGLFVVPMSLIYTDLTHRSKSRRGAWVWWPLLVTAFAGPFLLLGWLVGADPEMTPGHVVAFVVPAVAVAATTRIDGVRAGG